MAELVAGQPVTIGRALPGYTLSIRDEELRELPPGAEGELCVGGVGVAIGYLGLPDKTASKFFLVPNAGSQGGGGGDDGSGGSVGEGMAAMGTSEGRLYRTGDLARLTAEGDMVFLGRADGQVKVRGYRVELEEIEAHLAAVDGCAACVVAVQQSAEGAQVARAVAPTDTPFSAPKHDQCGVRLTPDTFCGAFIDGRNW